MTPKTIQEKKADLAQRAGIAEGQVETVRLQLDRLQREGILIDLSFHGGHLFTSRASYSELGIPQGDVRRSRLKAGSKDLIPSVYLKRLASLETRFRQSLDRYTFEIGAFGSFKWMPFTAYEAWREDWDRLQEELAALKQEILDNYWDFMDALAADFAKVAEEAWDAIVARRGGNADFVLGVGPKTFTSRGGFIDHVVSQAQAKMPSAEDIENRLYADYRTAILLGQADIEEDRLAADRHIRQREAERRADDDYYRRAREEYEARQAKIEAMRQAELEHARRQMAEMGAPINQALTSLRAQMNQDAKEILAGLKKHGKLRGRASDRVYNLIRTFHLLGGVEVMNDRELGDLLEQLKNRLDIYRASPADNRESGLANLTDSLSQIAATTHEAAEAVKTKMGPSRFSHLEV